MNKTTVTGMVLSQTPMEDYSKRIVLLTKERGKITAFARGARKQTSPLAARTNLFCFGTFLLYEGRTSYTIVEADITNYFADFMTDMEAVCYGTYFLDIAGYYTRENNDEKDMLLLLYQSLRALFKPSIPRELVRYIYEMKAIVLNGEFPGILPDMHIGDDTAYTIDFIAKATLDKLYTFTVSDKVLEELAVCMDTYRRSYGSKKMKSLEILEGMLGLSC